MKIPLISFKLVINNSVTNKKQTNKKKKTEWGMDVLYT